MQRPNFRTALALVFVVTVPMSVVAVSARTDPLFVSTVGPKGDRLDRAALAAWDHQVRTTAGSLAAADADACLPACSSVAFKSETLGAPSRVVHGVAMR